MVDRNLRYQMDVAEEDYLRYARGVRRIRPSYKLPPKECPDLPSLQRHAWNRSITLVSMDSQISVPLSSSPSHVRTDDAH